MTCCVVDTSVPRFVLLPAADIPIAEEEWEGERRFTVGTGAGTPQIGLWITLWKDSAKRR